MSQESTTSAWGVAGPSGYMSGCSRCIKETAQEGYDVCRGTCSTARKPVASAACKTGRE